MTEWNAREELIEHVGKREVKYVHIKWGDLVIAGSLSEVLPLLDFEYDGGFGSQELYGNIWYTDGTWSERGEYAGSEWWEYKQCPDIPAKTESSGRDGRVRRCAECIHFGELKGVCGIVRQTVCLAPITTEPPRNGTTAAKYRFVYEASAHGECELWTPNKKNDSMSD